MELTANNGLFYTFNKKLSYNLFIFTTFLPQIILIASCSGLISKLKNKASFGSVPFLDKKIFFAKFIAKFVFPIIGLAPISLGSNQKNIMSISMKQDNIPINLKIYFYKTYIYLQPQVDLSFYFFFFLLFFNLIFLINYFLK